MSYETKAKALLDKFDLTFSAAEPTVEIAYPNVQYEPTKGTNWVRFTINWGQQDPASIGALNNRYRTTGVITVQIFAAQGEGPVAALGIADNVVATLRGTTISGIRTKGTRLQNIGGDDGWFQINAITPFEYDET
mgnify:CR=1 FL=1